jgi:hypothetical protein
MRISRGRIKHTIRSALLFIFYFRSVIELDWNLLQQLIDPKLFVVVAACWAVGAALKHTPIVPDWTIIYGVTAVAVLLTIGLIGFSAQAVIQGILCGAFAVYGHQIIKQSTERDRGDRRADEK